MSRLWCARCQREMKPKKNGQMLRTVCRAGPYHLVSSDLWECPGCGNGIYDTGGAHPFAHHFQPDFEAQAERFDAVTVRYHEVFREEVVT